MRCWLAECRSQRLSCEELIGADETNPSRGPRPPESKKNGKTTTAAAESTPAVRPGLQRTVRGPGGDELAQSASTVYGTARALGDDDDGDIVYFSDDGDVPGQVDIPPRHPGAISKASSTLAH